MGTNYYIEQDPPCKKCGRGFEEYHIGKSSGGWCFTLHVEPGNGINSLEDIKKLWKGKTIKDEYSEKISHKKMLSIITERKWKHEKEKYPFGYTSWAAFHKSNHSEDGPNNLLRHKIDGTHCIGHGKGTYDYITGEFS